MNVDDELLRARLGPAAQAFGQQAPMPAQAQDPQQAQQPQLGGFAPAPGATMQQPGGLLGAIAGRRGPADGWSGGTQLPRHPLDLRLTNLSQRWRMR